MQDHAGGLCNAASVEIVKLVVGHFLIIKVKSIEKVLRILVYIGEELLECEENVRAAPVFLFYFMRAQNIVHMNVAPHKIEQSLWKVEYSFYSMRINGIKNVRTRIVQLFDYKEFRNY